MTKILKREANYPITIPAKVRFDLRLTANEKLLYGELYTFGGMAGTFKVSNQRLAALYHEVTLNLPIPWIKMSGLSVLYRELIRWIGMAIFTMRK
ncbi:hypothetical protein [Ligilactobacillus agilis]|uniref:hypothetical protein n=1 Tax=Ligilactobacillus agilis TaxID=1601 RepID=UPI0022E15F36|nr:hypothetical protein [Ligilactobacillus agilis]